jgi:hypothetical protein
VDGVSADLSAWQLACGHDQRDVPRIPHALTSQQEWNGVASRLSYKTSHPFGLTFGDLGRLWFTEPGTGFIGYPDDVHLKVQTVISKAILGKRAKILNLVPGITRVPRIHDAELLSYLRCAILRHDTFAYTPRGAVQKLNGSVPSRVKCTEIKNALKVDAFYDFTWKRSFDYSPAPVSSTAKSKA